MRTPAEFVVTRHLLSNLEATPSTIAKNCNIRLTSATRAFNKVRDLTGLRESLLFRHLLDIRERPRWQSLYFHIPNPEQWMQKFQKPRWLSGEVAAAMEDYDLVPERWLVYIDPADVEEAVAIARSEYAKVAKPADANLVFRGADDWLHLDPESDLVERGQRLLDYWSSRHVQLTAELMHA